MGFIFYLYIQNRGSESILQSYSYGNREIQSRGWFLKKKKKKSEKLLVSRLLIFPISGRTPICPFVTLGPSLPRD